MEAREAMSQVCWTRANHSGTGRPSSSNAPLQAFPLRSKSHPQGGLFERLIDDGTHTGLLILAPHGGVLEPPTDLQALRVLEKLRGRPASNWWCEGFHPEGGKAAFDRWHITSTAILEDAFPLLARVARRQFTYAVSFHGMIEERVLIGGSGPTRLKTEIRNAIRHVLGSVGITVDLAKVGEVNGGRDPKNIVNRYTRSGGVQIEQSPEARKHWKAIADAVAKVYASRF